MLTFGERKRLLELKNSELLTVSVDNPDLPCTDGLINIYGGFRYGDTSYLKRFTSFSIKSTSSVTFMAGRLLPSRYLGVTVSVSTSLSPMTNI